MCQSSTVSDQGGRAAQASGSLSSRQENWVAAGARDWCNGRRGLHLYCAPDAPSFTHPSALSASPRPVYPTVQLGIVGLGFDEEQPTPRYTGAVMSKTSETCAGERG